MDKKQRAMLRCESCGRFPKWDAYRACWWCDRCERAVSRKRILEIIGAAL